MILNDNGPRLEMWATDRIKPYDKNPRTLPEKAVAKVAGSLKTFGFQKPIVVDEQGVVIAGHVVLKAAQQAGFTRVPVLISQLDAKAAKFAAIRKAPAQSSRAAAAFSFDSFVSMRIKLIAPCNNVQRNMEHGSGRRDTRYQ